ncbi:C2H2-type domain-containing protein, partial [Aphis craccivora]
MDFVSYCKCYTSHKVARLTHLNSNTATNSTYECVEESCHQAFQCLNSFKRHISTKHICHNNPIDYVENSNANNYKNVKEKYLDTPTLDSQPNCSTKTSECFDIDSAINSLYKSAITFIMSLHNNNNFTVKDVLKIQNGIIENLTKPMAFMLTELNKTQVEHLVIKLKLNKLSSVFSNPFQPCSTDYCLEKWLVQNQYVTHLQQFTINNEICNVQLMGETIYDEKVTKGALLPLNEQFKKYLEHGDNLNSFINKLTLLKNDNSSISHFVQGNLWRQKTSQYFFLFFLYMDDVEINNPLGSHAMSQSISAIYYSFPLAENSSQLSNIFLAALIKTTDYKKFGNEPCLTHLIQEINVLEKEGIIVTTPSGEFHVHFILGLILGDNLGLNTMLDFSKSFSANYYCRFCKASKSEALELFVENKQLLRTINNYSNDINTNDFKSTGIYQESVLNQIYSFHVVTNYCVDVMHDIFEGICHYDICHVIFYYTQTVKLFSLEKLNNRKTTFHFGPIEDGNISPEITLLHLQNNHLKMSAREVMTFIHFFPLMIGDLIPEDDEVWNFVIILLKIVELLLSYKFTESSIIYLEQLIKDHNFLYSQLFNDKLKPKHHFLIHYPNIIRESGPPRHFWCFRFEGKHKEIKMYARSITSRKNITLTLAKKFQIKFAYLLMQPKKDDLVLNFKHKIKESQFGKLISDKYKITPNQYEYYNKIEYKGTNYKEGYYLTRFIYEMCLFKIIEIIVISNIKIIILTKQIQLN